MNVIIIGAIVVDPSCLFAFYAPWKESYDQSRQHFKKQRFTLPTKVCLVKAMVFPVVMYGCERKESL